MSGKIRRDADQGFLHGNTDEAVIARAFLEAGFDITWARKHRSHGSLLTFLFLKPNQALCTAYGFEYEILLVYSPYPHLEPRTFQAVEGFLRADPAKGRVEPMVFFLVGKARDAVEWSTSYLLEHKESRIAVPLAIKEFNTPNRSGEWVVKNALARHYRSLDRFKYLLPLERDTYFFGRHDELGHLLDACHRVENIGLFGLRKTGKTSLLLKLKRHLEQGPGHSVQFFDAQSTSIRLRRWSELLQYITERLLRANGLEPKGSFSPVDAADTFASNLDYLFKSGDVAKVTVILDEVEWISPRTAKDEHWNEDFASFWHAIRSYQNRKRNLNVILAGVNPSMVEEARFGKYQNPLFGIVSPLYLTGMKRDEAIEMVTKIGKLMGMQFTADAHAHLYDQYGGHPLLTRLACSYEHDRAKVASLKFPYSLDGEALRKTSVTRDRELVFYSEHVVAELEQFYPDEYELLERLAVGDYQEFVREARNPKRAVHLFKYGIVSNQDAPFITYEVVETFVAAENARREGRSTPYRLVEANGRQEFVGVRIRAIIEDFRSLEALVRRHSYPSIFGPNSFPEADRLIEIDAPDDQSSFATAITCLHRSFVESIDNFGKSSGIKNYFFSVIKDHYPSLYEALLRVRTYRHHAQHLVLHPGVDETLRSFVEKDLDGVIEYRDDRHWILFQRTLDELLRALQRELAVLNAMPLGDKG